MLLALNLVETTGFKPVTFGCLRDSIRLSYVPVKGKNNKLFTKLCLFKKNNLYICF